jgi:hypothetical protein
MGVIRGDEAAWRQIPEEGEVSRADIQNGVAA